MSSLPGRILITGATGLLGGHLTRSLISKGCEVVWLVRNPEHIRMPGIKAFRWSLKDGYVDPAALEGVSAVVHLAGANVGESRWTDKRKKEILESRTQGTALLAKALDTIPNQVRVVVSASATGYYGNHPAGMVMQEITPPGQDFLATVTSAWESAAAQLKSTERRLVVLRIGVVLSTAGGAVPKLSLPIKWMVGSPVGSGKQIISWIHAEDACELIAFAIRQESIQGVYNAAAPEVVSNTDFTRALARSLRRPLWLPNVPAFALRMMLGEMADMVLGGAAVSSEKIQQAGFHFAFPDLTSALADLFPDSALRQR